MTVPTITIAEAKKEGLNILDIISGNGRDVSLPTLKLGSATFFIMLITSIALLFSGPLVFIGVIIFVPFIFVSVFATAIMPIVMAGVSNEYLLQSKGGVSVRSLLLGICFCISFFIIPYIGLLLLTILFIYCFGIICEYIRVGHLKYTGNVA